MVKSLKINEEFEIFCSINNTDVLDETIIYNIDLEVILPDGVENTTKRTKTNINLFAKNSENITVFAKSTAVGPKNILCRATSDNGGNNQTSKTMNIKNKEIFRDESSSSGSSGRGNGGTNFFPAIPPQTCKNYTKKFYYDYLNANCIYIKKYLNLCNKTNSSYSGDLTIDIVKKCNKKLSASISDKYFGHLLNISYFPSSKDNYAFFKNKTIVNANQDYVLNYFLSEPIVNFYELKKENKSALVEDFYVKVIVQNSTILNKYNIIFNTNNYRPEIRCFMQFERDRKIIDFPETKNLTYFNELNKTHNIYFICTNANTNKIIENITIIIPFHKTQIKIEKKKYWLLWMFIILFSIILYKNKSKEEFLIRKIYIKLEKIIIINTLKLITKTLNKVRKLTINQYLISIKKTVNEKKLKSSWEKYRKLQKQYVLLRETQDYIKTKKIREDMKIIAQEIKELLKQKNKLKHI